MKYKWINKKNNQKVIVFFNGWGMDECVVKHLSCEDYDVIMFYDYNSLDIDFDWDLLNIYYQKNLIAWSMGVMIATVLTSHVRLFNDFSHQGTRVCINGTLKPIDEKFGIHPKIYDLTINGFNKNGREKFVSSMFDDKTISLHNSVPFSIEREISNQLSELIALKEFCLNFSLALSSEYGIGFYNKILISDNDKIIPTKSQVAFWGIEPNMKSGHCPFFLFSKWSELL